jgi:transposase
MAAVALANGLNANLLRRWAVEHEGLSVLATQPAGAPQPEEFIALPMVAKPQATAADVRIELRRGATTVTITWPTQAAGECAAWLREWLR